jgi:hypothetical protein
VKIHPIRLAMPKPCLGDVVFRENLSGQYEEATVSAILTPSMNSTSWTATLLTRNGIEFLASDVDMKSKHDWMPLGWTLTREGWAEPEDGVSGMQGKVARLEATVAKLQTAVHELSALLESSAPKAKVEASQFVNLPSPEDGEKFMTWRSRAVKASPFLKGHENGQTILRDAWHNKAFENIEVTL